MVKCWHCKKEYLKICYKNTKLYDIFCPICIKLPACPDCGSRDIWEHSCCGTMECRECENRW